MVTEKMLNNLIESLGKDSVLIDKNVLDFYSRDLFFEGKQPLASIAPKNIEDLIDAIKIIKNSDAHILPRGGGLSYTAGYLQTEETTNHSIVLDLRNLNRIIEINSENLTATVETGCTWDKLYCATSKFDLRAKMFGPSTGKYSTIGGSVSNNCMFFGSAKSGTSSENVVGLEILNSNAEKIITGSGSIKNGLPFFRNHGPDLTGLFLNDCGFMGIKTKITLMLEPKPKGIGFVSYKFDNINSLIESVIAVGRSGLASECLGIGQLHTDGSESPTIHLSCEGWTQEIAELNCNSIRSLVSPNANETDPQIPAFIRKKLFDFVESPLDIRGRMQIWTHGVFPMSKVREAYKNIKEVIDTEKKNLDHNELEVSISFACSGNAVMVEPVIYWEGNPTSLHIEGMVKQKQISKNKALRIEKGNYVKLLREKFRKTFQSLGATHMQHGRFYPYESVTEKSTIDLLKHIKMANDPKWTFNPGVLGIN